ncbi:MAG: glucose-6-phosphate isomerase [bacterium]
MKHLKFDFNNMLSFNIGAKEGVTPQELKSISKTVSKAHQHFRKVIDNRQNRIKLGLEWTRLPFADKKYTDQIKRLGNQISRQYENIISLGIGGSYLGLKAAQDALCPAYYNEFKDIRKGRPRIYFEGNNLDPETLAVLIKHLDPKKTFVIVISKSGETTETKAALEVVESWLKKNVGKNYSRQIFAITDSKKGSLRARTDKANKEDGLGFRSLSLLEGVGGRFSELNIGLLLLAISGVNISGILAGAKSMYRRCGSGSVYKNPAYMYAVLHAIGYCKKGKPIAIIMPFSETLKSTADWYVQLLAESLGKKYKRVIKNLPKGEEEWTDDKKSIINVGRTPMPSRGTNDLHSIQQNNIEGENNKAVTFIRVEEFRQELTIPKSAGLLASKKYSDLLKLAQEATEWALVREKRPNCTIIMPEISPFLWGELIFFFEMATAFEGELLGINAFHQPGVEGYKNYMYYKLKKTGISENISREITAHPVVKKSPFVL